MIYPVILSGGVGSRLWPISRSLYPKQLLPLVSELPMMLETALRVRGGEDFAAPIIVSNDEHRFIIAQQMRDAGIAPLAHILEPQGRNTAPAAAAAAAFVQVQDPKGILLILPADHHISNTEAFLAAIAKGATLAEDGHLVTFGVLPSGPETGYGYIKRGKAIEGTGAFAVERFVEKPDLETAKSYLAEGGYDWNAGIFMFRADTILDEMRKHCPEIAARAGEAVVKGVRDLDFLRLDAEAFGASPSNSIDYAVMEHAANVAVVPADMGWSDIGSWSALWEIGEKDESGNVISGDVLTADTKNSYIRAENGLVATVGVENLIIVETGDVMLVASRDRVQEVKAIVDRLAANGRTEHQLHTRVHRPWGYYEGLDSGERHQVKHLMVHPGASLSLQMHHHRAEHWVVVKGRAEVTVGDKVSILEENQSVYIPLGTTHRLANPGTEPLSIIEVQSGAYLGEDDIVRFDDVYGRDVKKPAAQ
ncbi:MAG: mannose-1-phosphate guanylyltransferase/mannose-6-phosphate isomerase [Parvibaculum sp.]|uniref:mannose-1-phosphate guanylyltransferase/mannose-6-phosphate isomerase n=1 Tax=Parvibaculum sp. TaxID=2024848 RepID=UPI000C5426B1|nr:mannose-1-phosphate guanylyltransferase/mannose-6-phosphate isomerase [Parvibaculum sp.]MAU59436.1 mannose-1-phosphate guanylyltransferase/mannose-6-phosphate isomerase [Parvibaculum sp.]|tara:strand:- start:13416 stop:14849 length:1434 start_codon:yes stop_codon:yes gene_type:complete